LCIFKQAGQRSGISKSASIESNRIISVVSPVDTARPVIWQRIIIFGMVLTVASPGANMGDKKNVIVAAARTTAFNKMGRY
jgi:hypothetical protein